MRSSQRLRRSTYILAISGGIDDGPVDIGVADVKDADINYPFLAWGKERAGYGHGREGTYITVHEYKLQGQSGQGSTTKEGFCGAATCARRQI
jgi:hypothetical protein